ncbi:MAG: PilZ domain-containing protein [Pseudomonadota bacterium]|nr:PilZ domain-containing protein [Pseudomonadota bacterium]
MNAEPVKPIDRRAERTHLFLAAALYAGHEIIPVRVRNLSPSGALIEGEDLPPVWSDIVLRRGLLEASGTIAWAASGRAGLSFNAPVEVFDWLPTKERQARVDRLAFALKTPGGMTVAPVPATDEHAMSMVEIVAELVALQAGLDQLGDTLARDALLMATCPELQFLDIAGQRIGRLVVAVRNQ